MNVPLPTLPGVADSAGALSGLDANPTQKQMDTDSSGGFSGALEEAMSEQSLPADASPGEAQAAHNLAGKLESLPQGGKLLPLLRQLLDAVQAGGGDQNQVLERIDAKLEQLEPADDPESTEALFGVLSGLLETYAGSATGTAMAEQAAVLQQPRSTTNSAHTPLAKWLPEALVQEAADPGGEAPARGLETESRAAGAERLAFQLQTTVGATEQRPAELVSAILTELKRMPLNTRREAGDATFRVEPSVTLAAQASKGVTPAGGSSAAPALDVDLPLQHAGWDRAFSEKIEWMVTQRLQGAQIRLNPAHLGPMEVRVQMHNEQASIQFTSSHAVVRDMLEAALPRLRDMLDASGVELVNVDISGQSFAQQQSTGRGEESGFASFSHTGEGDVQVPVLESPVAAMLDRGLLDLFV